MGGFSGVLSGASKQVSQSGLQPRPAATNTGFGAYQKTNTPLSKGSVKVVQVILRLKG